MALGWEELLAACGFIKVLRTNYKHKEVGLLDSAGSGNSGMVRAALDSDDLCQLLEKQELGASRPLPSNSTKLIPSLIPHTALRWRGLKFTVSLLKTRARRSECSRGTWRQVSAHHGSGRSAACHAPGSWVLPFLKETPDERQSWKDRCSSTSSKEVTSHSCLPHTG